MSKITPALVLSMLLAQAAYGANMRMCTDKDGHKTFTQGACPTDTSRQSIEVQPAQSPVTALRSSEKSMLSNAKKRQAQNKPKKKKTKKKTISRRRCGG